MRANEYLKYQDIEQFAFQSTPSYEGEQSDTFLKLDDTGVSIHALV